MKTRHHRTAASPTEALRMCVAAIDAGETRTAVFIEKTESPESEPAPIAPAQQASPVCAPQRAEQKELLPSVACGTHQESPTTQTCTPSPSVVSKPKPDYSYAPIIGGWAKQLAENELLHPPGATSS